MAMRNHTITPGEDVRACCTTDRPRVTVDLTPDEVLGYDHLIDRILDFTFDVLGIRDVELRVREGGCGCRTK